MEFQNHTFSEIDNTYLFADLFEDQTGRDLRIYLYYQLIFVVLYFLVLNLYGKTLCLLVPNVGRRIKIDAVLLDFSQQKSTIHGCGKKYLCRGLDYGTGNL